MRVKNVEPKYIGKPSEELKPFSAINMLFHNNQELRPDYPVRTRDGHAAYLAEFNPHTSFGNKVIVIVSENETKTLQVDTKGHYVSPKICHRWDIFNIHPRSWNRKVKTIRAYETEEE